MALELARSRLLKAKPSAVKIGRYSLIERMGRGASATVWRAHDPRLDRDVGLKLVERWDGLGTTRAEAHARVIREAQAVAALNHPNIVSIFDVGRFDAGQGRDGVFLAMEFLTGDSLRAWLRGGERSVDDVLGTFEQAARALQAAHDAGVVHRDFKPSNAMIDAQGRVRVIDFGLARSIGAVVSGQGDTSSVPVATDHEVSLTTTGTVMGTPAYMSPEQHDGGEVGPASDQYSFCVALFEALAGRRPFEGHDLETLATAKLLGAIDPPKLLRVPAWLQPIVLRGLEPQPDDRWPSIEALRRALFPQASRARRRWVLVSVGLGLGLGLGWLGGLGRPSPTAAPERDGSHRAAVVAVDDARWQGVQRARLLRETGDHQTATAEITELLGQLDDAENPPLRAAALLEQARLVEWSGASSEAAALRETAFYLAVEFEANEAAFEAAASLAEYAFERDPSAVSKWSGQAEAAFERGRLEGLAKARLLALRARAADASYRLPEASAMLEEARTLLTAGDDVSTTVRVLDQSARAVVRLGRLEEHLSWLARAAERAEQELGPAHPRVAQALARAGENHAYLGRHEDAEQFLERALEVASQSVGPTHVLMGDIWASGALAQAESGRYAVALDMFQDAEAVYRLVSSPTDRDLKLATLWVSRGLALDAMGRREDALRTLRSARDLHLRVLGADHVFTALHGNNISMVLRHQGRLDEAEREARAVATFFESSPHGDPSVRAFTYIELTRMLLASGRAREARKWADAAIRTWERAQDPGGRSAMARFLAAKASVEIDRDAARSYAGAALERVTDPTGREVIEAWLDEQGL